MSLVRRLGLFAVAVSLAACDKPSPDVAPSKPVSPVETQKVEAVEPVQVEAAIKPSLPPVAEPELPKPATQPNLEPESPTLQSQPKPVVKALPERVPLELSLNPNVFDPLTPYVFSDALPDKLLPPLFEEKPESESPFQLNGKLITNDHIQGGYWDSVEGAQLNFEFKQ